MFLLCFFKILYADDTCVLVSGYDLQALINMKNEEVISLNNRLKETLRVKSIKPSD